MCALEVDFAHKIGWHGNVTWVIEKLSSDRSYTATYIVGGAENAGTGKRKYGKRKYKSAGMENPSTENASTMQTFSQIKKVWYFTT